MRHNDTHESAAYRIFLCQGRHSTVQDQREAALPLKFCLAVNCRAACSAARVTMRVSPADANAHADTDHGDEGMLPVRPSAASEGISPKPQTHHRGSSGRMVDDEVRSGVLNLFENHSHMLALIPPY